MREEKKKNEISHFLPRYYALPNTNPVFNGVWTSTRVQGEWGGVFNPPSTTPPPLTEVFHFAMSGTGRQSASGRVQVTTASSNSISANFCCGFGCNSTTQTQTVPPTTRPVGPALPVTFIAVNKTNAACSNLMLCSIFLNNTFVPVVSVFGNFRLTNPNTTFVPSTVNLVADPCLTYVALPMVSNFVFDGLWNATAIRGSWGGIFSEPSNTPPPLFEVVQFAVSGGAAGTPRGVQGSIVVTTESMVAYEAVVCCGDCSPQPVPICPEQVTVPFQRYACTRNESSTTLNNLTANACLASNVMFMAPPNSTATTPPPPQGVRVPPTVQVQVSSSGFSPRSITARVGDSVLFVWVNGTNSVTSGSCASPTPNLFNSGLFATPHQFVLLVEDTPLFRSGPLPLFSRANCEHTATITTVF
jgi:plastocyanin